MITASAPAQSRVKAGGMRAQEVTLSLARDETTGCHYQPSISVVRLSLFLKIINKCISFCLLFVTNDNFVKDGQPHPPQNIEEDFFSVLSLSIFIVVCQ